MTSFTRTYILQKKTRLLLLWLSFCQFYIAIASNTNASTEALQQQLQALEERLSTAQQQKYWLMGIFALSILFAMIQYRKCQQKKLTEMKLLELNEEILNKSKQLQRINEQKDHLMRIIAHDLRSPISSFENLSKLMLFYIHKNRMDDLKDLMHDLDTSVHSLNNTLNNLLNLAFENDANYLDAKQRTCIKDLLETVDLMLQTKIAEKEIQIDYDIPESFFITINPELLKVVMRNILDNAIKFSNNKAVVSVFTRENDSSYSIFVKDQGIGIPKEKLPQIFDPYTHKQSTGTNGETGLGIGLILSNKFITAYGGKILIDSDINQGTTVQIIIPKSKK